jgi:hypothetical protein
MVRSMDRVFETVRLCANSSEAELIRLRLAREGIEAHLPDQSGVLGFGGLSPKSDGVRVQVLSSELQRARDILEKEIEDSE